jgi:hypothetical protein
VLVGLRLSPALLLAIHPTKNRIACAWRKVRFRSSRDGGNSRSERDVQHQFC